MDTGKQFAGWQSGKISTFGGPTDTGMSSSEGLALCTTAEHFTRMRRLFLPWATEPLGRQLDPEAAYIACRWDYKRTPPALLRRGWVYVYNPAIRQGEHARPIDWGPAAWTGRLTDISPGLARRLLLRTDDVALIYELQF
jgi:hypothetical protein